MSREVVVPVDRDASLPPVGVDAHGPEVLGEQLVVGSQVQPEVPADTNTPLTSEPLGAPARSDRRPLTSAGRRSSAASPRGNEAEPHGGERSESGGWREEEPRSPAAST